MIVELGHTNSLDGSVVSYVTVSDAKNEAGEYISSYVVGTDAQEVRDHLFDNPGLVTHLPGNTAILDVVASTRDRLDTKPIWVAVDPQERDAEDAADFERFLAGFWHCAEGKPADIEDTHWTIHSGATYAPGEVPEEN